MHEIVRKTSKIVPYTDHVRFFELNGWALAAKCRVWLMVTTGESSLDELGGFH